MINDNDSERKRAAELARQASRRSFDHDEFFEAALMRTYCMDAEEEKEKEKAEKEK